MLRDTLLTLARIHPWAAVCDVSGMPINRHTMGGLNGSSGWRRALDRRASLRQLRSTLAAAVGLEKHDPRLPELLASRVDEFYLTCPHHADVQAMYKVLSASRRYYYPHSLGSPARHELELYAPLLDGSTTTLRYRMQDYALGVVLGQDAVPVRHMALDGSYFSSRPTPWGREHHSIRAWETRSQLANIAARFPADVQRYYRSIVEACGKRAGVLLLAGGDEFADSNLRRLEIGAYIATVRAMVARDHVTGVLVKPHPMRSSAAGLSSVMSRLREEFGVLDLHAVEEYGNYPIELALAPADIQCAGALVSSSLPNIGKIFDVSCYLPVERLRALWTAAGRRDDILEAWLDEHRPTYTSV